jgi:hypothetical protein
MKSVCHTKPLAIDLFCGAGGLGVVLKQKGYDVIAVDKCEWSALSYYKNVSMQVKTMNLCNVPVCTRILRTVTVGRSVDLLILHPPSSGITMEKCMGYVHLLRPKIFVFLGSSSQLKHMAKIQKNTIGRIYNIMAINMELTHFGVPQRGGRMAIIGVSTLLKSSTDINATQWLTDVFTESQQKIPRMTNVSIANTLGSLVTQQFFFMYPRSKSEQCVFHVDDIIPPISKSCLLLPALSFPKRSNDQASVRDAHFFSPQDILLLQGHDNRFSLNGPKTKKGFQLSSLLPLPIGKYIVEITQDLLHGSVDDENPIDGVFVSYI